MSKDEPYSNPAEKLTSIEITVCANGYLLTKRRGLSDPGASMMGLDSWVAQGGIDVLNELLAGLILDRDPT